MAEQEQNKGSYHMEEVKGVFVSSMKQVLNNLSEEDYKAVIPAIVNQVGSWDVNVMLTPDELARISTSIFSDVQLRRFYLTLKYVFFSNMARGFGLNFIQTLMFDLAVSVSGDLGMDEEADEVKQYAVMSREVADTLMTAKMALQVMTANPWVIVIMLMLSFMDLQSLEELKSR